MPPRSPPPPLQPRQAPSPTYDEAKARIIIDRLELLMHEADEAGMIDGAAAIERALEVARVELLRGGTALE